MQNLEMAYIPTPFDVRNPIIQSLWKWEGTIRGTMFLEQGSESGFTAVGVT